MTRLGLILILAAIPLGAMANDTCRVAGSAFDQQGHPLKDAVVRLTDTHSGRAEFLRTDAQAGFEFADVAAGADYRVDLISAPTRVTGSHLPTRSILGMSNAFACAAGQIARADVHTQVD
jgi:hypothetical protein